MHIDFAPTCKRALGKVRGGDLQKCRNCNWSIDWWIYLLIRLIRWNVILAVWWLAVWFWLCDFVCVILAVWFRLYAVDALYHATKLKRNCEIWVREHLMHSILQRNCNEIETKLSKRFGFGSIWCTLSCNEIATKSKRNSVTNLGSFDNSGASYCVWTHRSK